MEENRNRGAVKDIIKKLNSSIHKAEWLFLKREKNRRHESKKKSICQKTFKRLNSRYQKKQGDSLKENSS